MSEEKKVKTDSSKENKLIQERRKKLKELRGEGFDFPNSFRRSALTGDLQAIYAEYTNDSLEEVKINASVAGRVISHRIMGKVSFLTIQDRSGQLQIFLQRDQLGVETYQATKKWDLGDIIWAKGQLFRTKTGELSLRSASASLLTKSLRPLPEKFHGLQDQEIRSRKRYLDLIVNQDSREVFLTRIKIVKFLRSYLDSFDFLEVETPMMQPIPGGAVARPFVTHHNALDREFYLRIAPELYLKRLIVGGFERVYEINRSFRNEGLSNRHNPEFTMLELYLAYSDENELINLLENMLRSLAETLFGGYVVNYQGSEYDLSKPFEKLTVE
ncbi:MAG: amino acid--tRNA ligase-related protein, partial [Pseudomonadota bacterium]|nr:amino acid--tRNA ligase-related protein [Pseudomonadota bacterium]